MWGIYMAKELDKETSNVSDGQLSVGEISARLEQKAREKADRAKFDKDRYEQVKVLFEYTKFHIGLYTGLGSVAVALLSTKLVTVCSIPLYLSVLILAIAGFAGGIIASSMPEAETVEKFMECRTGPYNFPLCTGRCWTRIEHAAFWAAVIIGFIAFLVPPISQSKLLSSMQPGWGLCRLIEPLRTLTDAEKVSGREPARK